MQQADILDLQELPEDAAVTSEVAVTHQTSLFSIWSDCLITVAAA